MFSLALLVVVVALLLWLAASVRDRTRPDGRPDGVRSARPGQRASPRADLERWVTAGLVTREQAEAVLAFEETETARTPAAPRRPGRAQRVPAVAEALGYLGGILAGSGVVLLVARAWAELAVGGRLAISGAAAAALFAAGVAVHEDADPALARLRSFLWLVSTAAAGLTAGVLVHSGFGVDEPWSVVLGSAGAVALESGLLWRGRVRPVQQVVCLLAMAVAVGAAVAHTDEQVLAGLAVWVAGAVLVVLGRRQRVPVPPLTEMAGAIASMAGAFVIASAWQGFGLPFGVATAGALLAVAVVPELPTTPSERLIGAVVGSVGGLQVFPGTIGYFAERGGLATGLAVWASGAALAVLGARGLVRVPRLVEGAGAAALVGGAALTGVQVASFAPLFGLVSAVGLVAVGTLPGRVLFTLFGSMGLLVNVSWAIGRFFPGQARGPLLALAAGAVILGVAVLLARSGRRVGRGLGHRSRRRPGGPRAV